jgi:polygalacturonase
MLSFTSTLLVAFVACAAVASPVVVPGPEITPPPNPLLAKRATSCTFTGSSGAASASKSQALCSTLVLSGITVPSGTTFDLSDLPDDTTVSKIAFTTIACGL